MTEADKAVLRKDKPDDLIKYHFGWGMGIRNEFGLWGGNFPLALDCNAQFGDPSDKQELHPDYISMIIMKQVWMAVQ